MLSITNVRQGGSESMGQYVEPKYVEPAPRGLAVWKQVFSPLNAEALARGEIVVTMPAPAEILCVDWEGDYAVVFVRVAPGRPYLSRRLVIAQTHREGLPPGKYLGTTRNPAGCAFHLFEIEVEERGLDVAA